MHLGNLLQTKEMPGHIKPKTLYMKVSTMAEMMASGQTPEVLFWVGCAVSFDARAQKITKAFATILEIGRAHV